MSEDIVAIAARLTKAQSHWLSASPNRIQPRLGKGRYQTVAALARKGLVTPKGVLTETGLAVQNHLARVPNA